MRPDIKKAVRERPRGGRGSVIVKNKSKFVHNTDYDEFDPGPRKVSIGHEATVQLGYDRKETELLYGPLRKFLHAQVGRKWNDVWSEICAVTDGPTGRAIREWFGYTVEIKTKRQMDRVYPVNRWYDTFYVSEDGILHYKAGRRYERSIQPITTIVVNAKRYHCNNDLWYEIELAPFPQLEKFSVMRTLFRFRNGRERTYACSEYSIKVLHDQFLGTLYIRSPRDFDHTRSIYGADGYCVKKRSANTKEIRAIKQALAKLPADATNAGIRHNHYWHPMR